jgi:uncharacterized protein (DUF58 family)
MHQFKRWVIFTAAVFLMIAAALANTPNLYFMAALLLLLPGISYVLGMFSLNDLEFDREIPGSGWEGEQTTFHVIVRSKSRITRLFLQAQDDLPEPLHAQRDGEVYFNAPPNSTIRVPYSVELTKRGAYTIRSITITAMDPLGIYSFSKRYTVESEILVYPSPQRIPDFVLSGAERYGFRDMPIAATRGSGVDPDGVREYIPGDPLRRMHWKSTARTGKLSVIEFEESRAVNVVMVLDLHEGTDIGEGRQSTLEYLVKAAASIAQTAIQQGASVRLVMSDTPDPADFAGRGSEHLYTVLGSLARAEANDAEGFADTFVRRVGILAPGTTMIVLTAGLDRDLPGAIAHYTGAGAQVLVFYADGRTFSPGGRFPSAEAQQIFIEQISGTKAVPVLIRRNDEGLIKPEQIEDVRRFTEN